MSERLRQSERAAVAPSDIEQIVQEVVRRVREGIARASTTSAGAAPRAGTQSEPKSTSSVADGAGADLVVKDKVVTLACLENRLAGVRAVRVLPRAVVTPAVVDELRIAKIELVRGVQEASAVNRIDQGIRFVWNDAALPMAWRQTLSQGFPGNNWIEQPDVQRAVEAVSDFVSCGPGLAVLVTPVPHVVICGANRRAGVRAAHVAEERPLQQAMTTLGINALVLDSRTCQADEALKMAKLLVVGAKPSRYRWLA